MCRCDISFAKPWLWLAALGALMATAFLAQAQGLKTGDDVPGVIRPWMFTGKHLETQRKRILATIRENDVEPIKQFKKDLAKDLAGNYHCPISEHGLNPVVLIFVKGADAGPELLQLLPKIDESVVKHERDRVAAFVIFLDDKVKDVLKDDDQRFTGTATLEPKLNPFKNMTAGLDSYEAVSKQFKLDDKADVTLVLFDRLKVTGVRSLMTNEINEKGIADALNDIEALIAVSKKAADVAPKK